MRIRKILINEAIGNMLVEEFGRCRATIRTALYFRETRDEACLRTRPHLFNRHLETVELYRRIRKRAIELGGVEIEIVKTECDDNN
jgi:hypothetical protein